MSEPVVETQELAVRFGGVLAVDHVNFLLRERELRCLIGPNGAGKSTFFKSITGQIRGANASGRVLIRGQDVTGWSTHQIVRLGIGIKTQVPSVMNGLTVAENLWLSARRTAGHDGAEAAVEKPLLHTWSLVVEEQFYLALPPMLWAAVRLANGKRFALPIALAVIGGASLALSVWLIATRHSEMPSS